MAEDSKRSDLRARPGTGRGGPRPTPRRFGRSYSDVVAGSSGGERAPDTPMEQAIRALYEQRYEEAEEILRQLTASSDRAGEAHFYLGTAHFLQGDYQTAAMHFATAIQQEYLRPEVMERLGDALFLLERYQEAIEAYRAALDRSPSAQGYARLGQAYLALGQREAAPGRLQRGDPPSAPAGGLYAGDGGRSGRPQPPGEALLRRANSAAPADGIGI
ncbi:MAG: hypothetical protein KatS3mg115_2272 [Candidatus Poribacteria bacterium]|nr:MAG: hypothetical protein KatS3mg115_2272 [Candidatus Poribacteria bacterium]